MNLLTDEVKNTRLIITLLLMLVTFIFGLLIMLAGWSGAVMEDFYQGAITMLLGFLVGSLGTAITSYFKNQEVYQAEKIALEKEKVGADVKPISS